MSTSFTVGDTTALSGQVNASLVGATAALTLRRPDGSTSTSAVTVTDAAAGRWSRSFLAGELDLAGKWWTELTVSFSGGEVQGFGPDAFLVKPGP